jgi:hypothetical protein
VTRGLEPRVEKGISDQLDPRYPRHRTLEPANEAGTQEAERNQNSLGVVACTPEDGAGVSR